MQECAEHNFKESENRGDLEGIPAMCVETETAQMYGVMNQRESGGIWITVTKCLDEVDALNQCKEPSLIDEYIRNLKFEVLYADNYLDMNDYVSPLRNHIISNQISHGEPTSN